MRYSELVDKLLKRKKPKSPGASIVPVKKVEVVDWYKGFKQNKDIVADIALTEELFTQLAWWFCDGENKEVTGFGVIDEEGVVRWICYTDKGTAGFVNNSAEGMIFAADEAEKAGFDFVNMHWHTHPNMGTFFSGTDKEHHSRRMRDLPEGGDMTFVVFDGIYWMARRFMVTKAGVEWNDGLVSLGENSKMALPNEKPVVRYEKHRTSWGFDEWEDPVVKAEKKPKGNEVLIGGEWPCCEECCQEFFVYGASLGLPGTTCTMCGDPIAETTRMSDDGTTRLSTKDEQLADEAEDALDAYLGLLQDGHNMAALDAMTEMAKTPELFDLFVKLYDERIGGKEDAISRQMGRHIDYFRS